MLPHRRPGALRAALVAVLLAAAVALLPGCAGTRSSAAAGTAPAGRPPEADEVRLLVTRDFGRRVLRDVVVAATPKLDVLRLLAENADVETSYGGGFVNAIDGLKSSFGGTGSGNAEDWFYWVDGVMADVGSAGWRLRGGETVWWDYHRWADAMFIPQALAAFPRPYDADPLPVAAGEDVAGLSEWAAANGLRLKPRQGLEPQPLGGLVVAATDEAARTPWLAELFTAGRMGVALVDLRPHALTLLAPGGDRGPEADAVALAAPDFDDPDRPFLIVVGRTAGDAADLLARLTPASLAARVGVAVVDGRLVALPWRAG